MTTLRKEIGAYEAMLDDLELEHMDEWVVVHDEKLVGSYETFQDAADDAIARFGRGPYLIRLVGEPPIIMPPYVWYRTKNANS